MQEHIFKSSEVQMIRHPAVSHCLRNPGQVLQSYH